MDIYRMAVGNMARAIRNQRESERDGSGLDAFEAARYLAVAFCKLPADVLSDIITHEDPLVKRHG
jgi:hypothetical protein